MTPRSSYAHFARRSITTVVYAKDAKDFFVKKSSALPKNFEKIVTDKLYKKKVAKRVLRSGTLDYP